MYACVSACQLRSVSEKNCRIELQAKMLKVRGRGRKGLVKQARQGLENL